MKLKNLFLFTTMLLATSFLSCDNEDDPNWNIVPEQVRNAFSEKYPSAQKIEWEDKKGYKVADFINNGMEVSAWFAPDGAWHMTETDLPFNSLPQAVKGAFQASEYSTWRVDDVDMLERQGVETIYIIEVEQQNKEIDLYFSTEGVLIKVIADNNNNDYENHLPQPVSNEIKAFIEERYPQSKIVEIELEKGRLEIDIIHDNLSKEIFFDTNNQWLYTSWEVKISTLPQVVANIVNNPQYIGYRIDDADYVETAQGNYYLLELEKGDNEIKVKVDEEGNILT